MLERRACAFVEKHIKRDTFFYLYFENVSVFYVYLLMYYILLVMVTFAVYQCCYCFAHPLGGKYFFLLGLPPQREVY
jgi:hypothetical protein